MRALLATTALVILGGAGAAMAQSTASDGLEELVVTAQRRSENLTNVPISVTALTGDQLAGAGVATTQDLTSVTPGLVWARSSFNSQPTIRGVGNRNAGPGDEPNVATFIDGVYQPQQSATLQELNSIERVEVLKGPQGTLFGRNATGGAVNIITKKPSFTPTGDVSGTYGRFNYRKGAGYLSGPIIDGKLAASLSGAMVEDDGYIRNVFLNTRQGAREASVARAKLLFTPTEEIEIQLNGLFSWSRDNISYSGQALGGNTQARRTANPLNIPLDILIPQTPRTTATQFSPFDKVRQQMGDAHVDIDLGWASLSMLASIAKARIHTNSDTDISPLSINQGELFLKDRWSNQEVVLASQGTSELTWLAGITGFQGKSFQDPNISNGIPNVSGQRTKAWAGWGEATYQLVENLYLTGGLRYSFDQKRSYNRPASNVVTEGRARWGNLSPRGVLRYEFADNANVYFSYTRGYKSGTFNPLTAAGALLPAAPEKIEAYEAGVKAELARGIHVSAAGYHYNYTNLQTTVINLVNGIVVSSLQNAPKATINGIEANGTVRVMDGLTMNAGLSVMKSKINDFPNASVVTPILQNGLPAGNSSVVLDVAGKELIRAPRFTANLGATYSHPLFGGEMSWTASAFFSNHYYIELTNRVRQPHYETVNASVTWTAPGDHIRLTAFVQNLTNALYSAAMISTTFNDNISYSKPRWFGVTVGYSF